VASAWRGLLADGSEAVLDVYEVVVDWDGHRHRVPADSADIDPLVGMSLLRGYRLRIDVMAGGNVTVEAI
jgi:predicted aspartyl protease